MLKEFDDLVKLALIHGRTLSTNQEFIVAADALSKMLETIERDLIEIDNALMEVGINRQRTLPDRVRALIARVHNWTPVATALPGESVAVLCATIDGKGQAWAYFIAYQIEGIWFPLFNTGLPVMVTHWCEFDKLTIEEEMAHQPASYDRQETPGSIDDETLKDLLSLVGVDCPLETIACWTVEQKDQAAEWAASVHLQASDNDDVEVPPRPNFLTGYGGHLDPARKLGQRPGEITR